MPHTPVFLLRTRFSRWVLNYLLVCLAPAGARTPSSRLMGSYHISYCEPPLKSQVDFVRRDLAPNWIPTLMVFQVGSFRLSALGWFITWRWRFPSSRSARHRILLPHCSSRRGLQYHVCVSATAASLSCGCSGTIGETVSPPLRI
jgi:hypothetical protein